MNRCNGSNEVNGNSLWPVIRARMLLHGDQVIGDDKTQLTYMQMAAFADKFAGELKEACYGILCRSELQAAKALLSCLAAGITAVPLSYRYGEIHCSRIIEKVGISHILTDGENGELAVEETGRRGFQSPSCHPALIMCTSGTTGVPKGAMITQENLLCNLQDIETYFAIGRQDSICIARPLYHCAVLTGEFLISLLKGVRIFFYTGDFNPLALSDVLRREDISVLCATPTLLQHLCRIAARQAVPLPLKTVVTSGECLTKMAAELIHKTLPGAQVYNVYGLTEASPRVAWLPPRYFLSNPASVGFPLPSLTAKIVDDQGNTCPAGICGELAVKGGSIMAGYYNDEEGTRRAIRSGWLHTGDIAEMDDEGKITIKCRKDNMIIHAGMNIYPQEIENALLQEPCIREALAYGEPDSLCGQRICLDVAGENLTHNKVLEICRRLLPSYELPSRITLVDALPRNGSGKIIRRGEKGRERTRI